MTRVTWAERAVGGLGDHLALGFAEFRIAERFRAALACARRITCAARTHVVLPTQTPDDGFVRAPLDAARHFAILLELF